MFKKLPLLPSHYCHSNTNMLFLKSHFENKIDLYYFKKKKPKHLKMGQLPVKQIFYAEYTKKLFYSKLQKKIFVTCIKGINKIA